MGSIRQTLAGAHVLLTGVTGFLGKVWLSHVLWDLPEIGRVTVIVRDRDGQSARERVEAALDTSPAFRPLRARHGDAWAAWASARIEVLAGDCAAPLCGLTEAEVARLARSADAVLHCAGLTDFEPEPAQAIACNVRAAEHAADLAACLRVPRLIQVSTCYVAGNGSREVPEALEHGTSPAGEPFDPEVELAALEEAAAEATPRDRVEAGAARARTLGWPNLYTFSKALAEHRLGARHDVAALVVRPSVIECAWRYPFAGWNEGLNTAGPLAWLLSSPFRGLWARPSNRFDVVPVDLVARGLTLALTAALNGAAGEVWQLGSSTRNPFTFERAIELNGLAYRKYTRDRTNALDGFLRHLDPLPAPASKGVGTVPWLARMARRVERAVGGPDPERLLPPALRRYLAPPVRTAQERAHASVKGARRMLGRVDRMLELYRPFTHDNDWGFRTDHVAAATAALDEAERVTFGFDVEGLDWRSYWVDIEYPGLRTWTFPLLHGRDAPCDPPSDPPLRLEAPAARAEEVA